MRVTLQNEQRRPNKANPGIGTGSNVEGAIGLLTPEASDSSVVWRGMVFSVVLDLIETTYISSMHVWWSDSCSEPRDRGRSWVTLCGTSR